MITGLTTRSCRLGGTISGKMKQWRLSGSTVGYATGLPAFDDGPALCRKRSRWSTRPSHCLPPTTSIEQRQNSPCHCFLNTLLPAMVLAEQRADHLTGLFLDVGQVHANEFRVQRVGSVLPLNAIDHENVGVGPDIVGLLLLEGLQ